MNTAIILAAGKGIRMKSGINKQYINLKGRPILSHTLEVFFSCKSIDEIIIVINPKDEEIFNSVILKDLEQVKPVKIVYGGEKRQQSVEKGLAQIGNKSSIVVIHDGARPFITCKMIEDSIKSALEYGAATLGVPAKETVKKVSEDGFVIQTLNRKGIWIIQTPQAFQYDIIVQAHKKARLDKIQATDDAALVEYLNYNVKIVLGDYGNIKITTKEDLNIAETKLNYKGNDL